MVFVIAEIGINWNGDLTLLKNMFAKAKDCQCDAVKLQCFKKELVEKHPKAEQLINSSVSSKNIEDIKKISEEIGIEWFATPMYPDAVKLLNPYVKRFKIRHSDGISIVENQESDILKQILETGKDVIISSQKNPKNSKYFTNPKIKWLYCVPKYPCEISDLDFSDFNSFDGYSNHLPDLIAPIIAATMGVEIIEVHVTESKSMDFIDNPVSFDFNELKMLVKSIRKIEMIKK